MFRRTFVTLSLVVTTLGLATPIARAEQSSTQSAKKSQPAITTPVNLNSATSVDLEALPGIGPATAKRILDYRQKSGGFKKIEDLMNVKGIGEKVFLKLKPLVIVTPPKTSDR
jgi:comEA protein